MKHNSPKFGPIGKAITWVCTVMYESGYKSGWRQMEIRVKCSKKSGRAITPMDEDELRNDIHNLNVSGWYGSGIKQAILDYNALLK